MSAEFLRYEDRQLLRKVVQKVHLATYPDEHQTNYEADKIIDQVLLSNPALCEQYLKTAIDTFGGKA